MHSGANGVPEETKSSNVTDTTQKRGSIQTRRGSMGRIQLLQPVLQPARSSGLGNGIKNSSRIGNCRTCGLTSLERGVQHFFKHLVR